MNLMTLENCLTLLIFIAGSRMKTRFYKILYKGEDVVYVGVTLRPITKRFKEHIISKGLNENYSVVEFDCIEHPEFTSLEVFFEERRKVVELEQKYIKEELEKGSKLLNISKGGEWGCSILEKLHKEKFFKEFGSYDNYKEYKRRRGAIRTWVANWVVNRSKNTVKAWIRTWVSNRSKNQIRVWLWDWVARRKKSSEVKRWVRIWVMRESENKIKSWLKHWVSNKGGYEVKTWLRCWSLKKKYSPTKRWITSWIGNRSRNEVKKWIRNWVESRSKNKVKVWVRSWVHCNIRNPVKVWFRHWVEHRKQL